MSTPTSDEGREDDRPDEGDGGSDEPAFSDPTAPLYDDSTTGFAPPPPPPPAAAASPYQAPTYSPYSQPSPPGPRASGDQGDSTNPYAYSPQDTPPVQSPAPPQQAPAAPQPGQAYPSYGQPTTPAAPAYPAYPVASQQPPSPGVPYPGYGAQGPYYTPQQTTNTSGLVLTIVAGLTTLGTCLVGIPSLIFGIMALTSQNRDIALSRRRSRIGWIVYAVNWVVVLLGLVAFIVFVAIASNSSSTSGYN